MVNRYTKAPPAPCPLPLLPARSGQQHRAPAALTPWNTRYGRCHTTPPSRAAIPQASQKNAAGCGLVSQQPAARGMHPGRAQARATGALQRTAAPAQERSDHQALQAGKGGNGKDDRNNGDLVLTRHGMSFQKQVNKPEEFRGGEEASGNRHQRMLPHRKPRAPALARNRARVNPYPEERSAV